jgi:alpha-tubulin suppressor-like RCC1 family protein
LFRNLFCDKMLDDRLGDVSRPSTTGSALGDAAPAISAGETMLMSKQVQAGQSPSTWAKVGIDEPSNFASNHFHSIIVGKRGAFSWGRGTLGVLGHGGEDDEDRPRLIKELEGRPLDVVSCGAYHSGAVTADGLLYLWGWEPLDTPDEGVIETTFATIPRPVSVDVGISITGVACGCFATAAWDAYGRLYTWGKGESGQLGHGDLLSTALPRPVDALQGVRTAHVAFGGVATETQLHTGFMLVLSSSGALFSCGSPVCNW